MKKGTKIFALVVLSLFLVSFLIGVVSAADTTFIDQVKEILKFDKNTEYLSTILSPMFLFGVLIFLIIFAIVDQIGLFGKNWIKVTISIVVAFLSAGFISIEWIQPLLNQYTALGITITLLFPFILVFYFLKKVAPYNGLTHKSIWGVYLVVVIINAILNWDKLPSDSATLTQILYGAIILGTLIMFWWSKTIFQMMFKEEVQEAVSKYEDILQLISQNRAQEARDALRNFGTQLSSSQRQSLGKQIGKMGTP